MTCSSVTVSGRSQPSGASELGGPRVGAHHDASCGVRGAVGEHEVHAVRARDDRTHGRAVSQNGAVHHRSALHRRGAAGGRDDRGAFLVERGRALGQRELRVAHGHLVDVEHLERHRPRRHRGGVVVDRDHRPGGEQVEATGHGHERLARLGLQRGPVGVGQEGEVDVLRRVIAVPQDAARVVRGAPLVAELELLEADDRQAAAGCVPGGRRPEGAEPDHCEVVGLSHGRPPRSRARSGGAASAGCRATRPPSGRTSPGRRTATTCRAGPIRRCASPGGW